MTTLALIGLGSMGKNYLKVISKVPRAQIKYICSKTKFPLANFEDNFVKLNDYKKLINFPIHGVIIATPDQTHFEIARFFIRKNVPILIEKPLTVNYNLAKKLMSIKQEPKVLVGHTLLYNPAYQKLKKELSKIGKIKFLKFTGANNKSRKNSSVLYDWGSHGISLFLDLLQKNPITLKVDRFSRSHDGTLDEILVEMEFDKNIKANLNLSWKSKTKKRKLLVVGEKGKIIFDDTLKKRLCIKNTNTNVYPKYSLKQPLVLEIAEFLNSISGKKKIHSDLKFGARVVEILDQIEQLVKPQKPHS